MRTDRLSGGTGMLRLSILFAGLLLPFSVHPALAASDEGSTPPILDDTGQPVRGSVASLEPVALGGTRQWILIRGRDVWNPVLLVLDSAPGVSHMGWQRRYLPDLEKHFIVVNWDQRGAGKSVGLQPQFDSYVSDAIELAKQLRERFRQDRIYVLAQGFGAAVGALAAQKEPALFHALVQVSPLANQAANERFVYDAALEALAQAGDTQAVDALKTLGPPPYAVKDAAEKLSAIQNAALLAAGAKYPSNSFRETSAAAVQEAVEYTAAEKQRIPKARPEAFTAIYPQLAQVDLASQAPTLGVPVYIVMGRYDATTSAASVEKYFKGLNAPKKSFTWFERSGEAPHFEEPAKFIELMTTKVLPETVRPTSATQ